MKRQLLAFEHFKPPHLGVCIADILNKVIGRNLLKRNFLTVTGDSASNNEVAVRALAEKLADGTTLTWPFSENFFHCSAHVFNLVAEALCAPFVKKVKVNGVDLEVDDDHQLDGEDSTTSPGRMLTALGKLSAMSRICHQSTSFLQQWMRICRYHNVKPLKLITPAPTRWGSWFEQIERAKTLRAVYEDMVASDRKYEKYRLSENDWELLDWLRRILRQLNICSKFVSVTTKPSIGFMIPCFSRLLDTLETDLPAVGLETPQERAIREKAVEDAAEKLRKYYKHTKRNPYFTFGMSKLPHIAPILR